MAVLELRCNNQSLEWEQDPAEIYAGNINIDSITFKFCELWDGYTITAVFYKDKKNVYQVLLDDTKTCLIPPELTETNGLVYVGVFGIKGEYRRASAVKSWYLKEGVITEGRPSEPTPDIYQQIINLCNEAVETANSVRTDADNGKFNGKDGKTPVKGVDYFDPEEKAELVAAVTEEITPALDTKADKPIIETINPLVFYAFNFLNNYNKEIRLLSTDLKEIEFYIANGEYQEDYTAGLSFDSNDTPTEIIYTSNNIINWVGVDCATVDGLSIFQPSANTHYDIVFYYNGNQFIGLVNGYVPASGNVVSE